MNTNEKNSELDPHLQILRNSIAPSNLEMNELVHNHQKFVAFVQRFNTEATSKILIDRPKEALVYLGEAERILQYGASCGKNIDRNLIIGVLHNEACCYQKLWELDRCSNYLEALIYNLNSHLAKQILENNYTDLFNFQEADTFPEQAFSGRSFKIRMQLVKYHLQYSAINSQLRNHENSLKSGNKAIRIIKTMFKQLNKLTVERKGFINNYSPGILIPKQPEQYQQLKMKTISGIAKIEDTLRLDRREDYLTTAKHYFKIWHQQKNSQLNEGMKENLKTFSIGSIVQIKPVARDDNKESTLDNENIFQMMLEESQHGNPIRLENYYSILNKVLALAMGYFTIATQLRLISAEKYKNCKDFQRQQSQEYKSAEIYHLIAIIITAIYVPFDMMFMRHIYTSFSNHFSHELTLEKLGINMNGNIMKEEFQYVNPPEDPLKKYKKIELIPSQEGSRISLYEDERKFISSRNSQRGLKTYSHITFRRGNSSTRQRQPESFLDSENESHSKGINCSKTKKKNKTRSQLIDQLKCGLYHKEHKSKNKKMPEKKSLLKPKQKSHKEQHSVSGKTLTLKKRVTSTDKSKAQKQQYYESILKDKSKKRREEMKIKAGSLTSKKFHFNKNQKHKKINISQFDSHQKKPIKNKFDKYYF